MNWSQRAPAWRRSAGTVLFAISESAFSFPSQDAKSRRGHHLPKTKTRGETHESVSRHHRVFGHFKERTRDLYDPRDLVAAHSISGVGVFLFLSRPRQSRLRRADH